MRLHGKLRVERGAIWLAIFVSLGVFGGVLFVATGAYNVAANNRHFDITEHIITFALDRSVAARGAGRPVPDLDQPGLVRLGALHYETGCAACHGRPGEAASPIVRGMYPEPPPLDRATEEWSLSELAWIVHNGLKMTGMPAWAGKGREDEVWPVIAFVAVLPGIDAAGYDGLVGNVESPDEPLALGDFRATVEFCETCHGNASTAPVGALAPPLTNQSPRYLYRALDEYRHDLRQSGMMEPIVAELSDGQMRDFAAHFGIDPLERISSPPPAGEPSSPGARLAWHGDRSRDIPACMGCHGSDAGPDFPRLEGLSQTYIANQLELFRTGVRARSPQARVMARIAGRLSDDDVEAVAAYLGRPGDDADLATLEREAAR